MPKESTSKPASAAKKTAKEAAPAPSSKSAPVKVVTAAAKAKAVVTPVVPAKVPLRAFNSVPEPIRSPKGDFDTKFLAAQRQHLLGERASLVSQAESLEHEAASLMEDLDPGDVQFDEESGEGDSLVVERGRDLALSAQARQLVIDIDAALARIDAGTYGYSLKSGRPIPRERLEAIPWANELVEEKVGGLGSR